ncbi:MAG: hypothetical protein ACOYXT_28395, partial [Bacteroidota bacterium]
MKMKKTFFSLLLVLFGAAVVAQPTSETEILASYQARKKLADASLLREYPVRNIGPTIQGGRIIDI